MADIIEFQPRKAGPISTDTGRTHIQLIGEHVGEIALCEAYGDPCNFADAVAVLDEARRFVEQRQLYDMEDRLLGPRSRTDGPSAA